MRRFRAYSKDLPDFQQDFSLRYIGPRELRSLLNEGMNLEAFGLAIDNEYVGCLQCRDTYKCRDMTRDDERRAKAFRVGRWMFLPDAHVLHRRSALCKCTF